MSSLRIDEGGDFALTLLGQEIITTYKMSDLDWLGRHRVERYLPPTWVLSMGVVELISK